MIDRQGTDYTVPSLSNLIARGRQTSHNSAGERWRTYDGGGRQEENNASLLDFTSVLRAIGIARVEEVLRVNVEFATKCSSIDFLIFAGKDYCHRIFDLIRVNRGRETGREGGMETDILRKLIEISSIRCRKDNRVSATSSSSKNLFFNSANRHNFSCQ